MDLEGLVMLGACSLLAGQTPTDDSITAAVSTAKKVWKEVLKQEKEN